MISEPMGVQGVGAVMVLAALQEFIPVKAVFTYATEKYGTEPTEDREHAWIILQRLPV